MANIEIGQHGKIQLTPTVGDVIADVRLDGREITVSRVGKAGRWYVRIAHYHSDQDASKEGYDTERCVSGESLYVAQVRAGAVGLTQAEAAVVWSAVEEAMEEELLLVSWAPKAID